MNAEPRPGIVRVTFDAGGNGSAVDSNPQSFVLDDGDSFSVVWEIDRRMNVNKDFQVEFGNVVPCHVGEVEKALAGYDFECVPILDHDGRATRWQWRFTRQKGGSAPAPAELVGEIEYEVFFVYRPQGNAMQALRGRIASLRKTSPVDPSMILPPKQSGPGRPGDKK